jgi:hypothetical protein
LTIYHGVIFISKLLLSSSEIRSIPSGSSVLLSLRSNVIHTLARSVIFSKPTIVLRDANIKAFLDLNAGVSTLFTVGVVIQSVLF